MSRRSRKTLPRLGRRREAAILPPLSLIALIALSTFTLFSYRSAVDRLIDERRAEVTTRATALASLLDNPTSRVSAELQRLRSRVPDVEGLAIIGSDGLPVAEAGDVEGGNLFLRHERPKTAKTFGPGPTTGDLLIGVVALPGDQYLRLDVRSPTLAAQRRSLPLLTTLVLAVNGALFLLFLFFLRHWMEPFDSLLERVRLMTGEDAGEDPDDIEHLIDAFDRAVAVMSERQQTGVQDDIAALQRTLSPSLESGLLLLDREGTILALNDVGRSLLDLDGLREDADVSSVLENHPELLRAIDACLDSGRGVQRLECEIESSDGAVTLGLTVHPLRPQGSEPSGWLILFADLTSSHREARERQLATSLGHIGELTAGLAHELRNSLASVRGYLTLIERRPDDPSLGDYLGEIRLEADHLQRVLEDFLAFAQPGSTRLERLPLESLIRRAADDPALSMLGIEVRLEISDSDLFLLGDRQLLERALRNLMHNAARAQKDCPEREPIITVRVARSSEEEQQAIVEIIDRGPGIEPEMAERLFVPFSTGRSDGVGLGLALSLRIISLHDGQLKLVDNDGPGATAVVRLPLGETVTEGDDRSRMSG